MPVREQCAATVASDVMSKFSYEEEQQLIEIVRKNNALFDPSHEKFKDADHKHDIWLNIANAIGKSVEDCKRKWKYIRDSNNRCKRKLETRSASSGQKKILPSAERVSFLNTVENVRRSTRKVRPQREEDNFEEDTTVNDEDLPQREEDNFEEDTTVNDEDLPHRDKDSPGRSSVRKRARCESNKLATLLEKMTVERNMLVERIEEQNRLISNAEKHEEDDVDLFFRSLSLTVKTLPKSAINEVKIKALIMVNELEEKYKDA